MKWSTLSLAEVLLDRLVEPKPNIFLPEHERKDKQLEILVGVLGAELTLKSWTGFLQPGAKYRISESAIDELVHPFEMF